MASHKVTKKILFFLLLPFFLVTASSQAVIAEINEGVNITGTEKAVIAFFRMADRAPDYEYWVKSGALYKTTPENQQEDILIKEWLRLDRGYGYYDVNIDVLEISALVIAQYTAPAENQDARFSFSFPNRKEGTIPVFSYPYGKEWVSMIINRLTVFTDVPLTKKQYESVRQVLSEDDPYHEVQLIVHARPTQADHTSPAKMYGENNWVMVSEIAYIQCSTISPITGETIILWDYVAPWYKEQYREKTMPEELKYPHPFDIYKKK